MAPRLLIAFDKFKGALDAPTACRVAREVVARRRPGWEVDVAPLCDGGDGFCRVMTEAAKGRFERVWARGPCYSERREALRLDVELGFVDPDAIPAPARARLGLSAGAGRVCIVEMASVNGLARLQAPCDPFYASTRGTGELLAAAGTLGASAIVLGIGGSATSDLGLGALSALGIEFLAEAGPLNPPLPADWPALSRVRGRADAHLPPVYVACDVDNPLLGPQGAAAVFGPQKGLRARDVARFDAQAERVARLCLAHFGRDDAALRAPGAGAAGGLAFGLSTGIGARLVSGSALVFEWLGLDARLERADWVLTGEGRFDESSRRGKAPGAVVERARELGKPVCVLAGSVASGLPAWARAISPAHLPLAEAMRNTEHHLAEAVDGWLRELA